MSQNLLQQSGAQPNKSPKYVPLFIDRSFTGLYTQRNVLHDPSDIYTSRFYGGRPDALWQGLNVELTNRLTLQRRPGLTQLSTAVYPTLPLRSYSFQLTDGTIRLIIDTSSLAYPVTSVANSSGGQVAYSGSFGAVTNDIQGLKVRISGFTNPNNNGVFTVITSSNTSVVVNNPNAQTETATASANTAGGVYWDQQNGTTVLLFAKGFDVNGHNAGQSYFQGVAGTLYVGDGVETWKYTPLNTNLPAGAAASTWNWGIVAPTKQPSVTVVPSGSAATQWVANTVWSTMGLIYDSATNTTQQLNSVNATGVNSTQLGTTGSGNPVWAGVGGATIDGSVTWTNRGPIVLWTASTLYQNGSSGGTLASPCIIYDPATKACYYNANGAGLSGTNYPKFKPGAGQTTSDHQVKWAYLGQHGLPGIWQKSHVYATENAGNADTSSISEPIGLANGLPTNQTVFWQVVTTGGTSSSSYTSPKWNTPAGQTTGGDGDMIWLSLGSDQWVANTSYFAWTASGSIFSAIRDSNGNFQVAIQTGTSKSGSHPTWATAYGDITTDGTVIWTCVGTAMTWAASTQWFLPTPGFSPPSSASPYGGASVVDSNNDVEFVINSGLGGGSTPSWAGIGGTTTDGAATWYNLEAHVAQSLSWTNGYVYAYSFKARSLTDFYTVDVAGTSNPPVPPGLNTPLPFPTGSETGVISTASPVFTITGSNAGAVNTISGFGSTDPQVDTIVIWRSADGGGPSNMFELTEIPAPQPIGGVAQPWSFKDFLPDLPTNVFPGLNELIQAPIDDTNDPPPNDFLPMAYNYQRIWGARDDEVPFSGGPDVITGNPNEAFNPSDSIPFLAPVTRLVKTPQGLVTFLTDSIEIIAGGPLTSSFYSVTLAPGMGLLSFNALDVYAGEIYFFASDNQLRLINPSLSVSLAGFPLGDQFANLPSSGVSDTTWNPRNVYVAVHQNGIDNCVFVADGSTGWYRLNPHQIPGAAQGPEPIWSPFAQVASHIGGCLMVQSVETTPGIKKLLVGSATSDQRIYYRDLTVFTDNGFTYDANFTMGSITLCHPGQLALLKFLEFDFSKNFGIKPTVSYLLNEISGTFTPFVQDPVPDPPSLYGTATAPSSYNPSRYYFLGNASLARCRHLQIKVDFGQSSIGDEVLTATIFGRLMIET
jgi:hypothetical protein